MDFLTYSIENKEQVILLLIEHINLTILSVASGNNNRCSFRNT